MITVKVLADRFNLSRSAILSYEKEGLLLPKQRTKNGYRWYGESEIKRLELILAFSDYGMPLKKTKKLLAFIDENPNLKPLELYFRKLGQEANLLQQQQRRLLEDFMCNI